MASSEPTAVTSWSTPRDAVLPDRIGGKAAGLFRVPREWVPPFFVVQRGSTFEPELDRLLRLSQNDAGSPGLIVRSNAVSEATTNVRGVYVSVVIRPDAELALGAIEKVLLQPTRPQDEMLAIVQLAVRSLARGHLSNERHVSERRARWVIEEEAPTSSEAFQPLRGRDKGSDALDAVVRGDLLTALRHVAFRLAGHEHRQHCEWVWDGRRVWIVQRDTAPDPRGGPVHAYLASRPRRRSGPAPPHTTVIRPLDAQRKSAWAKLSRPMIFHALGMPTAEIWHLAGDEFVADEANGYARVRGDLEALMRQGPIVIRCDVRLDRGYSDLSLPTSDPVRQPDEALAFMRHTAATHFGGPTARPEDWAFLPAALVPARASVMAQARPGGQRVRLDALWGYPDGVGLLSHDKWSHNVLADQVDEHRAHKDSCLLCIRDGGWHFEPVPAPQDWGHTINPSEARMASSWARRLADHLDCEVQLMVLARIDGWRGPEAMLPWHYTDHTVPTPRAHVAAVPSTGLSIVTQPEDLEGASLSGGRGLLLRPEVGWHRDPAFITEVGTRAAAVDLPVYFEGSVLGHPYYLIKSTGAIVVPVGQDEPDGVQIEYHKLVRDGVPDIVRSTGGVVRAVRASGGEAQWLLRQKLVEEAFEVGEALGDAMVEELADLAETVLALCRHVGIAPEDVERARRKKLTERGGFDNAVYLQATSSSFPGEEDGLELPPLFGPDVVDDRAPAPRAPTAAAIEESNTRRIVVKVPVVPPLREGMPLREYGFDIGRGKMRFRHRGAELEITIESDQPAQAPGQLSLPFDP